MTGCPILLFPSQGCRSSRRLARPESCILLPEIHRILGDPIFPADCDVVFSASTSRKALRTSRSLRTFLGTLVASSREQVNHARAKISTVLWVNFRGADQVVTPGYVRSRTPNDEGSSRGCSSSRSLNSTSLLTQSTRGRRTSWFTRRHSHPGNCAVRSRPRVAIYASGGRVGERPGRLKPSRRPHSCKRHRARRNFRGVFLSLDAVTGSPRIGA